MVRTKMVLMTHAMALNKTAQPHQAHNPFSPHAVVTNFRSQSHISSPNIFMQSRLSNGLVLEKTIFF